MAGVHIISSSFNTFEDTVWALTWLPIDHEAHELPLDLNDHKMYPHHLGSWIYKGDSLGMPGDPRITGARSMISPWGICRAMALLRDVSRVWLHLQGSTNLILQQCYKVLSTRDLRETDRKQVSKSPAQNWILTFFSSPYQPMDQPRFHS